MKWLVVLLASIALLVIAWVMFGPGSAPLLPPGTIAFPSPQADKSELIRGARQLHEWNPSPSDLNLGFAYFSLLLERIPADEWGAVQKPAFAAWVRVLRTPGSHEGVTRLAPELYRRFARWGSVKELEHLVRSIPTDHWAPQIEQGLDEAAAIPSLTYEGSRLQALVTASIRAGDVARANRYLAKSPQAEARLAEATALHEAAAAGTPDFAKLATLWAGSTTQPELLDLAERAGAAAARVGRNTNDYARLIQGVEATRAISLDYWKAVLWRVAKDAAPGVFGEEPTLSALAKAIGPSAFEAEFWEQVQPLSPGKTHPEAMWRVACAKKVIALSGDSTKREAALRAIVREHLAYDARQGRKDLESLRSAVGEVSATRVLAELGPELEAAERQIALRMAHQEENRKKVLETKPGQSGGPGVGGLTPASK